MSIPENYLNLLELITDGVYFVDPNRKITYWNRAAESITGYSPEQVTGRYCMDNILMHVDGQGRNLCKDGCPLKATLEDGQVRESIVSLHHASGHRVPVVVRVMPVYEGEQITGAVEVFYEEASLAMALSRISELQQAAMLDELTRIGNRRMADSQLAQAFHDLKEHGVPYGVLFIDIDNFKAINDEYGHEVGDRIIQMVARSLSAGLRAYDFVARWGGEEFIVILSNIRAENLEAMAERLRILVENSSFSLITEGNGEQHIKATISIGGVMANEGDNSHNLVQRADRNMYKSKRNGRNRVTV
jgi:diguanylate cyclase (GGDEF)-like protein/PAS domain S-box-containing protein